MKNFAMCAWAVATLACLLPAQAQNLAISMQANVTLTPAVDEDTQIRVSGQIKRLNGQPAANILVRFWQPDTPTVVLEARSDANGIYQIALSEGLWRGAACGADTDYSPAHWQTRIDNNRVTFLQAQIRSQPRIDTVASTNPLFQASNSALQSEQVVVTGQGFGCAGRLRFVYSHMIDIHGQTRPVDYGVADVEVTQFITRTDDRLMFVMPSLRNATAHQHIARLYYEQGAGRSNARVFAQAMYEILPEDVSNGAGVVASGGGVSTGSLRDLLIPVGPAITSGFDYAGTAMTTTSTLGLTGLATSMVGAGQHSLEPASATTSGFAASGATAVGTGFMQQIEGIDAVDVPLNLNLRGGLNR
jgi:hypothetical protein